MNWIKGIIAKLLGKQLADGTTGISKAKLSAVIFVIVTGIQQISTAWGHPIVIPDWVFKVLEGAGLWALRDSIKA